MIFQHNPPKTNSIMQKIQKNYLSNFEKNAQKTSKVLSKLICN
jgi:hypothetical protein